MKTIAVALLALTACGGSAPAPSPEDVTAANGTDPSAAQMGSTIMKAAATTPPTPHCKGSFTIDGVAAFDFDVTSDGTENTCKLFNLAPDMLQTAVPDEAQLRTVLPNGTIVSIFINSTAAVLAAKTPFALDSLTTPVFVATAVHGVNIGCGNLQELEHYETMYRYVAPPAAGTLTVTGTGQPGSLLTVDGSGPYTCTDGKSWTTITFHIESTWQ